MNVGTTAGTKGAALVWITVVLIAGSALIGAAHNQPSSSDHGVTTSVFGDIVLEALPPEDVGECHYQLYVTGQYFGNATVEYHWSHPESQGSFQGPSADMHQGTFEYTSTIGERVHHTFAVSIESFDIPESDASAAVHADVLCGSEQDPELNEIPSVFPAPLLRIGFDPTVIVLDPSTGEGLGETLPTGG